MQLFTIIQFSILGREKSFFRMGEKKIVKRGNIALINHYDGGKTVVHVIGL